MQKFRNKIVTVLIGLLLTSCSYIIPTPGEAPKSEGLRINFKHSEWKRVSSSDSDADLVFQNEFSKSLIYVESVCQKYQDVSLEKLSTKLLEHFSAPEVLRQETLNYQNREALKTFARGKLDGVSVDLTFMNLKKNDCLYDFVMITPKANSLEESRLQFEIFLKSIEIP
jgi:uncharacterized GH25 family protein